MLVLVSSVEGNDVAHHVEPEGPGLSLRGGGKPFHFPVRALLITLCASFRLVLIFLIATAVNACWVMEQPAGSSDVLPYHSRMDWYFNEVVYVTRLK